MPSLGFSTIPYFSCAFPAHPCPCLVPPSTFLFFHCIPLSLPLLPFLNSLCSQGPIPFGCQPGSFPLWCLVMMSLLLGILDQKGCLSPWGHHEALEHTEHYQPGPALCSWHSRVTDCVVIYRLMTIFITALVLTRLPIPTEGSTHLWELLQITNCTISSSNQLQFLIL